MLQHFFAFAKGFPPGLCFHCLMCVDQIDRVLSKDSRKSLPSFVYSYLFVWFSQDCSSFFSFANSQTSSINRREASFINWKGLRGSLLFIKKNKCEQLDFGQEDLVHLFCPIPFIDPGCNNPLAATTAAPTMEGSIQ